MGRRGTGYRAEQRRDRRVLVIDFTYRDSEGIVRRFKKDASVQTSAGARAEAARLQALAAATGSPEGKDDRKPLPTFRAFVEGVWREQWAPRYKPSTRERYDALLNDQGLLAAFGRMHLDEIDAAAVTAYAAKLGVKERERGKGKRGVQSWPHTSLVSSILRAAKALGVLAEMPKLPPPGKPKRKLPRCPTDDDVTAIMGAVQGWLRVASALAIYAGLRSGEVRAIEAGDVSLARGEIHVQRAISADQVSTTKSDEDRIVPIAPELDPILREALKGKKRTDRLVLTKNGTTPSRQNILWRLQRTEQRHGVHSWSFHQLRHQFCTSLIRRGANIAAVQAVAGHQDVETTMRYVHAEVSDARRAMSTQRALTSDAMLN